MATGSAMRVSDAERDAAAAELREHFASGRLTQDELSERLDAAFAARTRGDLSALFTDLPPAGTGAGWPGSGDGPRWQYQGQRPGGRCQYGHGGTWTWGPGPAVGAVMAGLFLLMPVLILVGIASAFGIAAGRPAGIVLIIAVLAVLRRLLFAIFGRRRARGSRPWRRPPRW